MVVNLKKKSMNKSQCILLLFQTWFWNILKGLVAFYIDRVIP